MSASSLALRRVCTTVRPAAGRPSRSRVFVAPRAELGRPQRTIPEQVATFLQRYDVLSTGVGVGLVTGFCWMRGQDAGTALSITLVSTIVALVLNEVFFNSVNDRSDMQ